jgi:hypothetical protein
VATRGQLFIDGHLIGLALVGQPAGDHDRAAERHAAARVEGDHAELPVPAGGVGGVGAGQDERARPRPRRPEHLPHLGQGGELAPRLGQVVGRIVGLYTDLGVHRAVGGQEAGQRRLRAAGAGRCGQHQRAAQPHQQCEQQTRQRPPTQLRPRPYPQHTHGGSFVVCRHCRCDGRPAEGRWPAHSQW